MEPELISDGLRLSVEELALMLTYIGQDELARDMLAVQLGTELTGTEVRARIVSAGHSLMARGLLQVGADGHVALAEPLLHVARILSHADYSLRYTRTTPEDAFALTYHFVDSSILEHEIEQGVLHRLSDVQNPSAAINGGLDFFGVDRAQPFECLPVEIPSDVLNEVTDEEDVSIILQRLEASGVPTETRTLLAEDLQGTEYRGTALRIEYGEGLAPRTDRGLLLLQGSVRLWLLLPGERDGGQRYVRVSPATPD